MLSTAGNRVQCVPHTNTHTHVSPTHIHTRTQSTQNSNIRKAHTYTHTNAYIHKHTHTYTHAHTRAHTYAYTHLHAHTHTHTHTHTRAVDRRAEQAQISSRFALLDGSWTNPFWVLRRKGVSWVFSQRKDLSSLAHNFLRVQIACSFRNDAYGTCSPHPTPT